MAAVATQSAAGLSGVVQVLGGCVVLVVVSGVQVLGECTVWAGRSPRDNSCKTKEGAARLLQVRGAFEVVNTVAWSRKH